MDKPVFAYVTYIATTPEKLWQALTDGTFTQQYWAGIRLDSTWAPGASVTFRMGDEVYNTGDVLAYEPHRRLSYSWKVEIHEVFRRERPSRVTFEIEPIGSEVKLTVTHDDFDPDSKVLGAVSNGWPMVLASLKSFLEIGHGLAVSSPDAARRTKEKVIADAQAKAS
jgi:uncharacterized protein YndB with AHSA1/START domain